MRRALVTGLLVAAGSATVAALRPPPGDRLVPAAAAALAAERLVRDEDIRFFSGRVERDPTGSLDLVRLGALLLQRARDSGNEVDWSAAEAAARRSFRNRARDNAPALQLLAGALLGQHRFREARSVALTLLEQDRDGAVPIAVLGEIQLELGAYAEADSLFRRLTAQRFTLRVAPRYARWLEIRGRAAEARRLLEWAAAEADRGDATPLEQRAWYQLRLGELALRFGAHREAARRLDQGLALVPDDWRLLSARARLALSTRAYGRAIALGDSSLGRHLDPATLATVGDAWAARGDTAKAEEYFRALEASTQGPAGGFHRAWYLALLDHGRRVPEVLEAVTRELAVRQDVYGHDVHAWALFKAGRNEEARRAMSRALAWGTEDPQLRIHARAIEAAR